MGHVNLLLPTVSSFTTVGLFCLPNKLFILFQAFLGLDF